jgi:hypothetical protein
MFRSSAAPLVLGAALVAEPSAAQIQPDRVMLPVSTIKARPAAQTKAPSRRSAASVIAEMSIVNNAGTALTEQLLRRSIKAEQLAAGLREVDAHSIETKHDGCENLINGYKDLGEVHTSLTKNTAHLTRLMHELARLPGESAQITHQSMQVVLVHRQAEIDRIATALRGSTLGELASCLNPPDATL